MKKPFKIITKLFLFFQTEAIYHNNLGNALRKKRLIKNALDSYQRALELQPNYVDAYTNVAIALMDLGKVDNAISNYMRALELNPRAANVYRNLSTIYKFSNGEKLIDQMETLLKESNLSRGDMCGLHFALAKAFRDLREYRKEYGHLKSGNSIRKSILGYNIEKDVKIFKKLKKTQGILSKVSLHNDNVIFDMTPIFIVGMPRSGTTLVEQILSSHRHVHGAGELNDVKRLGFNLSTMAESPTTERISKFRAGYLSALRTKSDGSKFVTDKMPHNFRFIPLIFAALPEAKVVHVHRDPRATCWSNFQNYFSSSDLGYTNDLNDIVKYYELYKDLMQNWENKYSSKIYNLYYEKLTLQQV
jgi:tetratricopeptide (TPR) repeat protein